MTDDDFWLLHRRSLTWSRQYGFHADISKTMEVTFDDLLILGRKHTWALTYAIRSTTVPTKVVDHSSRATRLNNLSFANNSCDLIYDTKAQLRLSLKP